MACLRPSAKFRTGVDSAQPNRWCNVARIKTTGHCGWLNNPYILKKHNGNFAAGKGNCFLGFILFIKNTLWYLSPKNQKLMFYALWLINSLTWNNSTTRNKNLLEVLDTKHLSREFTIIMYARAFLLVNGMSLCVKRWYYSMEYIMQNSLRTQMKWDIFIIDAIIQIKMLLRWRLLFPLWECANRIGTLAPPQHLSFHTVLSFNTHPKHLWKCSRLLASM